MNKQPTDSVSKKRPRNSEESSPNKTSSAAYNKLKSYLQKRRTTESLMNGFGNLIFGDGYFDDDECAKDYYLAKYFENVLLDKNVILEWPLKKNKSDFLDYEGTLIFDCRYRDLPEQDNNLLAALIARDMCETLKVILNFLPENTQHNLCIPFCIEQDITHVYQMPLIEFSLHTRSKNCYNLLLELGFARPNRLLYPLCKPSKKSLKVNRMRYGEMKERAQLRGGVHKTNFVWLMQKQTPEMFKEILCLGNGHEAFDMFWNDNVMFGESDLLNLIKERILYELTDSEFSKKLEILLENWPFEKSAEVLLLENMGCNLPDSLNAKNKYGNLFALIVCNKMHSTLDMLLKKFPDAKNKQMCSISLYNEDRIDEDEDKDELINTPFSLVELALDAKSYYCLRALLLNGFNVENRFKFYNLSKLSQIRRVHFQNFCTLSRIPTENLEQLKSAVLTKFIKPNAELEQEFINDLQGIIYIIEQNKILNTTDLERHGIACITMNRSLAKTDEILCEGKSIEALSHYTYLQGQFYVLPYGSEKQIITKLITKLLYRLPRYHGLSLATILKIDGLNKIIFEILCKLDAKFRGFTLKNLRDFLNEEEKAAHDFFGYDLSEDSDEVRKEEFKKRNNIEKLFMRKHAQYLIFRTGLHSVIQEKSDSESLKDFLQRREQKGELVIGVSGMPRIKTPAALSPFDRQKLFCPTEINESNRHNFARIYKSKANTVAELERQKHDDLNTLNFFMAKGDVEGFKQQKLKTKFVIAFYRGYHYNIADWDASARRNHRKTSQIGVHQFSSSIRSHTSDEENQFIQAQAEAKRIQSLKEHKDPEIQNLFRQLQAFYSNNYDKFHELLRYAVSTPPLRDATWNLTTSRVALEMLNKFKHLDRVIREFFPNPDNPFISTGDLPFHALRYCYGLKIYPKHEDEQLSPRWKHNGQAERPYSGKLYVSVYTLDQYLDQPCNHMLSMHNTGQVTVISTIKAERETSFFAYQPGENIVYEHVAKYPSFSSEFDELIESKYGLSRRLYDIFKAEFQKHPPHTEGNWNAKLVLGELLCAYNEALILDFVNSYATEQGAVLIYRNRWGCFEFSPSNLHAEKDKSALPPAQWHSVFSEFIQSRKKIFASNPQKDLIDACICNDLTRVESILTNIQTVDYAIKMPEYEEEGDKLYSPLEIAKNHQILFAMLSAHTPQQNLGDSYRLL